MAHARKRFGQHFLADSMVIGSLLREINPSVGDRILEIGPGRGAISRHLIQLEDVDYVGVEIDRDLVAFLREKYPDIKIHSEDILKADLEQILDVENNSKCAKTKWKVIGNLPYNISSPLLMKMIEFLRTNPGVIGSMIFMFQKELASRLTASKGSKQWSKLSIYSQLFMEAELLFDVHPESFSPPPKVMSSVLRITPREDQENLRIPNNLSEILNVAFSARRKTLQNVFKDYSVDWEALQIQPTARPDQLGEKDFLNLSRALL